METYYGQVRTPADAIILFEACRLGLLPRVQRRLSDKERLSIRSGSVFVWDENEASMRRWTDGKSWSASRVAGSFLTYREMDGKRGSHSQGRAARIAKSGGVLGGANAGATAGAKGSDHNVEDGVAAAVAVAGAASQQPKSRKSSAKYSDPGSRPSQENGDGARYKPDGLVKQSFSIVTSNGQHLHLISYYSRNSQDLNAYLKQPSTDPALAHIRPDHALYPESTINDQQNLPVVTRAPMNSVSGSFTPASASQPSPGIPPYSSQSSGAPTPSTQTHAYPPPVPMAYLPQIPPQSQGQNQGQVNQLPASSPHYLPPPTTNGNGNGHGHGDPYAGYYPVPVPYMHPYYLQRYYEQQQQHPQSQTQTQTQQQQQHQQPPNQDCPTTEQQEQQQQQQPVYPHPSMYPPIIFGQGYPRPQDQDQPGQEQGAPERSEEARRVDDQEGAKEELISRPQSSSSKEGAQDKGQGQEHEQGQRQGQAHSIPTEPRLESTQPPASPAQQAQQQQQQQSQSQSEQPASFVSALSPPHIQTQTHVPSISSLIDPSSPHPRSHPQSHNPNSPMTTTTNPGDTASPQISSPRP